MPDDPCATAASLIPEGSVLVKITSHRARQRMERIVGGRVPEFYSLWVRHHWFAVPQEHLEAVLRIPSITRSRPRVEIHRTWSDL